MSVAYYDTLTQARADTSLSSHSDIFTFGLKVKNDGGGAHYKKYATTAQTPFLSFTSAATPLSFWGLVPDDGTVNPLQSEKTTDKERIQECIDFIQWWNETTTGTPTIGTITDYSSSRRGIKLIIPANRTFLVDTQAIGGDDPVGLVLRSSITIEGENRQTSIIKLVEASTDAARRRARSGRRRRRGLCHPVPGGKSRREQQTAPDPRHRAAHGEGVRQRHTETAFARNRYG